MALMHEDFFTLGGLFAHAGFVVEEFYCTCQIINEDMIGVTNIGLYVRQTVILPLQCPCVNLITKNIRVE